MKINTTAPSNSITEAQEELIGEFGFFEDWMDRYQYLIDLGKQLSDFPEDWKIQEYKIEGCQSQVWIKPAFEDGRLFFQGISDSAIVSGLIAVVTRVYSGRTPEEIKTTPPEFINKIGFTEHLSPTRSNGLHAMLDSIFGYADLAG
ncbi:MAG: SufE family protein [Gammaproteobacteria bacterium]|nr:SufE family protein [Gammaproteobacteria bacterium]